MNPEGVWAEREDSAGIYSVSALQIEWCLHETEGLMHDTAEITSTWQKRGSIEKGV